MAIRITLDTVTITRWLRASATRGKPFGKALSEHVTWHHGCSLILAWCLYGKRQCFIGAGRSRGSTGPCAHGHLTHKPVALPRSPGLSCNIKMRVDDAALYSAALCCRRLAQPLGSLQAWRTKVALRCSEL